MKTLVAFPIFNSAVNGKCFTADGINPGCGGTQFVTIMLALHLARCRRDYEVHLLHDQPISIREQPDNLKQSLFPSLNEAINSNLLGAERTVLICTAANLLGILGQVSTPPKCRIIPWIHHPFYYDARLTKLHAPAYVSVGTYQYYSNEPLYKPHWHISNLFFMPPMEPISATLPRRGEPLHLLYLGALIPGKGFLHIAKQWTHIKSCFPSAILHVIGSTQTYGKQAINGAIPTTKEYAQEILNHLPIEDIDNKKVIFYGNLGIEKFNVIRNCHAALLNPTGATEAFPASPLECMSIGLPVIASDDYGMSDIMRYFPELSLQSPSQLTNKLKQLFTNPLFYKEMSERSLIIAKFFFEQSTQSLIRWQELIEMVCDGHAPIASNPPMQPLYGSRPAMGYRKLKHLLKCRIKHLILRKCE